MCLEKLTLNTGWWLSHPSENISQFGLLFPIYGKIKIRFQTTNQNITYHHVYAGEHLQCSGKPWLQVDRNEHLHINTGWSGIWSGLFPFSRMAPEKSKVMLALWNNFTWKGSDCAPCTSTYHLPTFHHLLSCTCPSCLTPWAFLQPPAPSSIMSIMPRFFPCLSKGHRTTSGPPTFFWWVMDQPPKWFT